MRGCDARGPVVRKSILNSSRVETCLTSLGVHSWDKLLGIIFR